MITFVIPSIDRETLSRTLKSLVKQTNKNWNAIVVYDNIDNPTLKLTDERFNTINLNNKYGIISDNMQARNGGVVRNFGIDLVKTEWIGFVDDDDTLTEDYVEKYTLEVQNNTDVDCIIFKSIWKNGMIVPPFGLKQLMKGQVGIYFAVKKAFLDKHSLRFENSYCEDYDLLKNIEKCGGKIIFSDHITYKVRM